MERDSQALGGGGEVGVENPLKPWTPPPGWKKWQGILARKGLSVNQGKDLPTKRPIHAWQKAKLKKNLLNRPTKASVEAVLQRLNQAGPQPPASGRPVALGSSGTVGMARSTPETMHGYVAANNRAGRVKVRDAGTT